jgi:hypothetical protein
VLFGLGAAAAGSAIYAAVAMITGLEIGLIAILVGIMVGKAVRAGSGGRGGRPQQITAVLLTYFAITTSYLPVTIYHLSKEGRSSHARKTPGDDSSTQSNPATQAPPAGRDTSSRSTPKSLGLGFVFLIAIFAAAPFMMLTKGTGILTLVIIFIGLRQAWKLTGRTTIRLMGPYQLGAG